MGARAAAATALAVLFRTVGPAAASASAAASSAACARVLLDLERRPGAADELEGEDASLQEQTGFVDLREALACAEVAQSRSDMHPRRLGRFLERVALHPDCVNELGTRSQAQTRCPQKLYKVAIHSLKAAGDEDAADAMWHRAVSLRAPGSPGRIGWPSTSQTPTVWLEGLRSKPIWDCATWPFVRELEAAAPRILAEIQGAAPQFETAYPYLTQKGTWQDMFLVRGRDWNMPLCALMPGTCRMLLPELPTRPGVPFATAFHEEVVVFRSLPGASVSPHCGSSNMVVNLHLTLSGGRGTKIHVGGQSHELQDGRALCFQDSFFHAVDHGLDGAAERISLVVRVMHPELSLAAYGDAERTDVAELVGWDSAAELNREVERLRAAYRELAQATAPSAAAATAADAAAQASRSCAAAAEGCAAAAGHVSAS
eukprot:TRINITY_DN7105_c0_g1_i1.p1 TRINITY_DN7105_c0_g1~~TRINITY_DN7105_c0_g1_i1.p1  ORF type:complete len:462 (+),score=100.19 TRINITY_DN7105_c0_g1_i1:101-1387(+)